MERQAFLLAAFSAVLLIPLVAADASAYCAVDVYQVEVEGSVITGNIRNIGNESASISYSIWVENNGDDVVKSGSLLMEPGQVRLFSQAYGFSQGVYTVTINASADCGAWDEESMGHMVLEDFSCRNPYANEGEYRCDYGLREYMECTSSGWVTRASGGGDYCHVCPDVCGDGVCNCGETSDTCYHDCRYGECQAGYLETYRCAGNKRQRLYRGIDCTEEWRDIEVCSEGCSGGSCEGEGSQPGQEGCSMSITSLDYLSSITQEIDSPYVTISILNNGQANEDIDITLRVGGSVKSFFSRSLDPGKSFTKKMLYDTPEQSGTYDILVTAEAGCGAEDSVTAELQVSPSGESVVIPPSVVSSPEPELQTAVDIYPSSLDIARGSSDVVVVSIDSSREQPFSISVDSPHPEWFEYPRSVTVSREKSAYVYVTPSQAGQFQAAIRVEAMSEDYSAEEDVSIFVALPETYEVGDTILGTITVLAGKALRLITDNMWATISFIIIAIIIIMAIAHRHLKTEYEDLFP